MCCSHCSFFTTTDDWLQPPECRTELLAYQDHCPRRWVTYFEEKRFQQRQRQEEVFLFVLHLHSTSLPFVSCRVQGVRLYHSLSSLEQRYFSSVISSALWGSCQLSMLYSSQIFSSRRAHSWNASTTHTHSLLSLNRSKGFENKAKPLLLHGRSSRMRKQQSNDVNVNIHNTTRQFD